MKLVEAVKGLVQMFWHDNTRPCSNTKDVLKHSTVPPMSSRDFIHSIMCPRQDGQTHYLKQCVDGSCNNCGGLSLWSDCIHESEDQAFRNAIVEKQNYQYETYQLNDGKESRKIKLVTSQVNS